MPTKTRQQSSNKKLSIAKAQVLDSAATQPVEVKQSRTQSKRNVQATASKSVRFADEVVKDEVVVKQEVNVKEESSSSRQQ